MIEVKHKNISCYILSILCKLQDKLKIIINFVAAGLMFQFYVVWKRFEWISYICCLEHSCI